MCKEGITVIWMSVSSSWSTLVCRFLYFSVIIIDTNFGFIKALALYNDTFGIREKSGKLYLKKALDYETLTFYQYKVIAKVRQLLCVCSPLCYNFHVIMFKIILPCLDKFYLILKKKLLLIRILQSMMITQSSNESDIDIFSN